MLPWLVDLLKEPENNSFRVFGYVTVRIALALSTAFLIVLLSGPKVIEALRRLKVGQNIRKITLAGAPDLAKMHGAKQGTPTMGGVLIVLALLISVSLFARLSNPMVMVSLSVVLGFGLIGFIDDYLKVVKGNHKGVSAKVKLAGQVSIGALLGWYLQSVNMSIHYEPTDTWGNTNLLLPFLKNVYPNMGWLFIPFVICVVTCTSNAVNLTDGLDGLASGCVIIYTLAFMPLAYLVSRLSMANYLLVPYVPGADELSVVMAALIGATMGFLWFNAHPAQVFMGDVGSLTMGGLLGTVAILIRQELLIILVGGIFVAELLSVVIQVSSFKLRGKRVFLMSPLHHHYERKGLNETQIVVRFWIAAALLALFGLSTLKLR